MKCSSLKKYIKGQDKFGKPITLTFKSKSSIQTLIGGLFSILTKLGIVAFFCVLMNQVIEKSEQKYN